MAARPARSTRRARTHCGHHRVEWLRCGHHRVMWLRPDETDMAAGSLSDRRTVAARQLGQEALPAAMEVLDRAPGAGPVLTVQAAEPVFDGGEGRGQVAAAVLVVQGQLA